MDVLEGLNDEQRRAAEAIRGPVCILAGAGSGKTTTITRRIAHQVAEGAFRPGEILAVTFTDKAAGVMKSRLAALGVSGVVARTFHSAALAQLHHFAPGSVGRILPTKALLLRQIANGLPAPFKFRPAGDLATEIEWAKAQRLPPEHYRRSLGDHTPPIPADLMDTVYREYERRKSARGEIDFEDLLELTVRLHESDPGVRATFQGRYRAFTVDEYQDVNLLQQTLLDLWLGDRDDLCVVGDDYQSIYGFTGASPRWLLGVEERFPAATVVRLESNYRSSPEVLELANRLVPLLEGAEKTLRATRPSGPAPSARRFVDSEDEDAWIAAEAKRLQTGGTPYEEMVVLARTNARLADFEEAFHDAGIPFQGSSLLQRDAARRLLKLLDRDGSSGVARRVRELAEEAGMLHSLPDKLGERELTRQSDLSRLVRLAAELDDGEITCSGFAAELRNRFDPGGQSAKGVHLMTYHRAKGLEFDAVFLPRLEEKELPSKLARTVDDEAEERRLFYVGITRARRFLAITWSKRPSPFVAELGLAAKPLEQPREPRASREAAVASDPVLYDALAAWRKSRAKLEEIPAYIVFHNSVLVAIADARPGSLDDLAEVPGVGPAKLERYGDDVLGVVSGVAAVAS
ncbi:MAG TPA: ATP-dependent DNA helicase UvrD2 [Gaiellaceae bacterium]|nr:ATP-dependent DNA helicase UvrD2 [Gaiellaceae bacterium]